MTPLPRGDGEGEQAHGQPELLCTACVTEDEEAKPAVVILGPNDRYCAECNEERLMYERLHDPELRDLRAVCVCGHGREHHHWDPALTNCYVPGCKCERWRNGDDR